MTRAWRIVWTVIDRVVVAQARAGRMRWEPWPRGFGAIGVLGAFALAAAALLVLVLGVLRPGLRLTEESLDPVPVLAVIPLLLVASIWYLVLTTITTFVQRLLETRSGPRVAKTSRGRAAAASQAKVSQP